MFRDVYKVANKKIPINLELFKNTEAKISREIKGISKTDRILKRFKFAAIPVCFVIVLSLALGIPRIINNSAEINTNHSIVRNGPAPMPFQYPIEIKADSNPLHSNQEFTIQTAQNIWEGSIARIYYIEDSEADTDELMYKHVIPKDSKLIGTVEIVKGQWSYKWKAPESVNKSGYGTFYIAAESDKGIISGLRVETLPYNSFDILPKDAVIGQEIKYTISGFSNGCTMEVYLLQDKIGTSGETISTLGIFKNTNGSVTSSFKLSELIDGNKITPGQYIIQATIIPKDEKKEGRQAVFGYFKVK